MKTFTIEIPTIYPSLNAWYAGNSWRKRHAVSNKVKGIMNVAIHDLGLQHSKFIVFSISVTVHNKYDVDNCVTCVKLFVDCMKDLGIIPDDSKKHFRSFCIAIDESLPKGTTLITVNEVTDYVDNSKVKKTKKA